MCKPSGSRRIIIDAFLTRGQNPNNELASLDYDGNDFQIGEFIKKGQLKIAIHAVKNSAEIKTALRQRPVHIAVFFDQSKYTVQYGPSQKSLVHFWKRAKIQPTAPISQKTPVYHHCPHSG